MRSRFFVQFPLDEHFSYSTTFFFSGQKRAKSRTVVVVQTFKQCEFKSIHCDFPKGEWAIPDENWCISTIAMDSRNTYKWIQGTPINGFKEHLSRHDHRINGFPCLYVYVFTPRSGGTCWHARKIPTNRP